MPTAINLLIGRAELPICFTFNYFPSFALNANAYIRICFTIDSKPLLRVGDKCSFNPILSIK